MSQTQICFTTQVDLFMYVYIRHDLADNNIKRIFLLIKMVPQSEDRVAEP